MLYVLLHQAQAQSAETHALDAQILAWMMQTVVEMDAIPLMKCIHFTFKTSVCIFYVKLAIFRSKCLKNKAANSSSARMDELELASFAY